MRNLCIVIFLSLFVVQVYASDEIAGSLRNVSGEAFVERGGKDIKATDGFKIQQGDILKTGKDGLMGIIFKDDSRMSIGPNSRLDISKFVFKPAEGNLSMLTKISKGTATYNSGRIGKLSPQSVSVQTPTSTIGIRGTSFYIKVSE
ncbi:MAG: FecR domain-containing protein [Thermodesulfovibrionales bacterium]|nr:FecR domain-containing protein [Thermodesulfovibrionales bacterium]